MKFKAIILFLILCMFLLVGCNIIPKSFGQTNDKKSTANTKNSTGAKNPVNKIEVSAGEDNSKSSIIQNITYNNKLKTVVTKAEHFDISGKPASNIDEIVNSSPIIVEISVLDVGRQINIENTDGSFITSKAQIDKIYKGSLKKGDIINIAEQGGVRIIEKFGEQFNDILLPEDNSQPLQKGDRAILFLYENRDFSQLVGEITFVRASIFFSKFIIDPTSNTVQLSHMKDFQLSDFKFLPLKTKKMKYLENSNLNVDLEFKEMGMKDFLSHLPNEK